MIMKRETKAFRILNQARERMEIARQNVESAEGQLGIANAALNAHTMAYYALEKELAPTPRKTAKKPAASTPTTKEQPTGKDLICGVCGNDQDYQDHFQPSPNYHEFDPPKSVARAPRKSKPKSEGTNFTPSIKGEMENVLSAPNAGD
jgi:hypothetical protein